MTPESVSPRRGTGGLVMQKLEEVYLVDEDDSTEEVRRRCHGLLVRTVTKQKVKRIRTLPLLHDSAFI